MIEGVGQWLTEHALWILSGVGALAGWVFKSHRQEIKEIKMSISRQKQSLDAHKLFASENFVKHWQLEDIREAQRNTLERIDEIYKILTNQKTRE